MFSFLIGRRRTQFTGQASWNRVWLLTADSATDYRDLPPLDRPELAERPLRDGALERGEADLDGAADRVDREVDELRDGVLTDRDGEEVLRDGLLTDRDGADDLRDGVFTDRDGADGLLCGADALFGVEVLRVGVLMRDGAGVLFGVEVLRVGVLMRDGAGVLFGVEVLRVGVLMRDGAGVLLGVALTDRDGADVLRDGAVRVFVTRCESDVRDRLVLGRVVAREDLVVLVTMRVERWVSVRVGVADRLVAMGLGADPRLAVDRLLRPLVVESFVAVTARRRGLGALVSLDLIVLTPRADGPSDVRDALRSSRKDATREFKRGACTRAWRDVSRSAVRSPRRPVRSVRRKGRLSANCCSRSTMALA
jgi:hypothetical protein